MTVIARLLSAVCAFAALTALAALHLSGSEREEEQPVAREEEEQSRASERELDAALRMDTCTPVLAALSTALERVSALAR